MTSGPTILNLTADTVKVLVRRDDHVHGAVVVAYAPSGFVAACNWPLPTHHCQRSDGVPVYRARQPESVVLPLMPLTVTAIIVPPDVARYLSDDYCDKNVRWSNELFRFSNAQIRANQVIGRAPMTSVDVLAAPGTTRIQIPPDTVIDAVDHLIFYAELDDYDNYSSPEDDDAGAN